MIITAGRVEIWMIVPLQITTIHVCFHVMILVETPVILHVRTLATNHAAEHALPTKHALTVVLVRKPIS